MSKIYFNPGCALSLYRPEAENEILSYLNTCFDEGVQLHKICCHHNPQVEKGSLIINVCAGCDKRFSTLYDGISTVSLWEVIDKAEGFPFPDYSGLEISVHDACPIRDKPQVHSAVRSLLKKMNITVIEAENHSTKSVCCGDSLYPALPLETIHQKMEERASSMPCENVAVYCVSCIKAMHIGGKTPRHLADLLYGKPTEVQIYDTVKWHEQLNLYIESH